MMAWWWIKNPCWLYKDDPRHIFNVRAGRGVQARKNGKLWKRQANYWDRVREWKRD